MSKLSNLKFKKFLTIEEAASHLSSIFEEPLTEADIWELFQNKHLKLSIHIPKTVFVYGTKGHPCGNEDFSEDGLYVGHDAVVSELTKGSYGHLPLYNSSFVFNSSEIIRLEHGDYDLVVVGAGENIIEKELYTRKYGKPFKPKPNWAGFFVQTFDGESCYEIKKLKGNVDDHSPLDFTAPNINPMIFLPCTDIPNDCFLSIRADALQEFKDSIELENGSHPTNGKIYKGISNQCYLEALGLMARIIAEKDPDTYKKKKGNDYGEPNSTAIADKVQAEANKLLAGKDRKHEGFTNLKKAISAGISEIEKQL